jgi:hypothetical protein
MVTREFVINLPSWENLDDVIETARSWPRGENELLHTRLTTVPSKMVKPPSIKECKQHIECRLHDMIELEAGMSFIIGDIVDIVVDEELCEMGREERIRTIDPPVYLGDDRRRFFYFGNIGDTRMIELKLAVQNQGKQVKTRIPWEETALKALSKVPSSMLEMVVELVEDEAQKSGASQVSYEFYKSIEEQYAPKDMQDKFD